MKWTLWVSVDRALLLNFYVKNFLLFYIFDVVSFFTEFLGHVFVFNNEVNSLSDSPVLSIETLKQSRKKYISVRLCCIKTFENFVVKWFNASDLVYGF